MNMTKIVKMIITILEEKMMIVRIINGDNG